MSGGGGGELSRRESGLSDGREGSVQRQGVKVVRRDKFSEWKGQGIEKARSKGMVSRTCPSAVA